ncbi:pyridine nucleotide-disulfide oxidoreductase [Pseudacidovorax intermedius]|uniref:Pyridine nucleotide-disulfide oxidoreductase n=1 Tax=Pseudacidovorax intermedius TaxID=433924 RepID=A0A370FAE4_9BURK|nr:pyridine nucleotide-disulfide oxidoreductase [Pseudacidovorax intermedius]
MRQKLVVIGNGMAGMRTVQELLAIASGLYDITVFGAEPHPHYNRILLSPVLAGERSLQDIVLSDWNWYREQGITLHAGRTVTQVDRARRIVRADDGTEAAYDRLLLATGSQPVLLPVPGAGLRGVLAHRDIADTEAMIEAARTHRHAVVIGGGVLGLEAASGLARRGMAVTVVHRNDWLMERQLDAEAATLLRETLETQQGLNFRLGAQTEALLDDGQGWVRAVRLTDGSELPADLVVMAIGIRPHIALAQQMRLHCERGIVVSDTLQTVTDGRIYAVGECAQHRGVAYGLVAPLFEQGRVAANHLAQMGIGRYEGSTVSAKLKVTGVELLSAGDFMGGEGTEQLLLRDPDSGVYRKLVLKDERLIGACLYGDAEGGGWYLDLLREGRSVAELREQLIFGEPVHG